MAATRVLATDLDGTLIRSDGTVSDRSRRALAAAEDAGLLVVFVTGRPPRWMAPVVEATGHRGLAVCANGGVVYDLHTEAVVEEHPLDPAAATAVVDALREAIPGLAFAVERGARGFGREPAYRTGWPQSGAIIAEIEELLAEPMVKLLVRHEGLGPDELLARAREVAGELATMTHSSRDGLLEISAAGVSKASTLALLCEERGYAATDVLAVGDMPNDLPMLGWAGRSAAVANAHPEVLAAVDEVTASNDEDGVALLVEKLLDTVG